MSPFPARLSETLQPFFSSMMYSSMMYSSMTSWWAGLSRRERRIVLVAVPVLLLWLVWQLIVMPLEHNRQMAEQRLASHHEMLARVKQTASEIVQLQGTGARVVPSSTGPLDQLVNRTARPHQLKVTGMKSKQGLLQVSLGDAPFDQLLKWVTELEQSHGVTLKQLRVKKTGKAGIVQIDRLELTRE